VVATTTALTGTGRGLAGHPHGRTAARACERPRLRLHATPRATARRLSGASRDHTRGESFSTRCSTNGYKPTGTCEPRRQSSRPSMLLSRRYPRRIPAFSRSGFHGSSRCALAAGALQPSAPGRSFLGVTGTELVPTSQTRHRPAARVGARGAAVRADQPAQERPDAAHVRVDLRALRGLARRLHEDRRPAARDVHRGRLGRLPRSTSSSRTGRRRPSRRSAPRSTASRGISTRWARSTRPRS
jgi:hypothetical protein